MKLLGQSTALRLASLDPVREEVQVLVGSPTTWLEDSHVKRDEPGSSQDPGTVLKFRRKPSGARNNRAGENRDIFQLLDLSKYENPNNTADDFKRRMIENIAAVLLLGALVGIGAVDVISLEQIQHCASVQDCSH